MRYLRNIDTPTVTNLASVNYYNLDRLPRLCLLSLLFLYPPKHHVNDRPAFANLA